MRHKLQRLDEWFDDCSVCGVAINRRSLQEGRTNDDDCVGYPICGRAIEALNRRFGVLSSDAIAAAFTEEEIKTALDALRTPSTDQ